MKSLRESFLEDYRPVGKEKPGSGKAKIKYIYIGPWYMWTTSRGDVSFLKKTIATRCLLAILAFAFAGLQRAELNMSLFVMVPGTLSIIALMYETIGVLQFYLSKERMKRHDFQAIDKKLGLFPLAHALLLFVTASAALYLLIFSGFVFSLNAFSVVIGYTLSACLSLWNHFAYHQLGFTSEKNPDAKAVPIQFP